MERLNEGEDGVNLGICEDPGEGSEVGVVDLLEGEVVRVRGWSWGPTTEYKD